MRIGIGAKLHTITAAALVAKTEAHAAVTAEGELLTAARGLAQGSEELDRTVRAFLTEVKAA